MCSKWIVLFLECAVLGICCFWNVYKMEFVLFGMCCFWMCTKWNVLFLECASFGMSSFCNVLFVDWAQNGILCNLIFLIGTLRFYKNSRHIVPSLTTASHQKSTAAKECDSPAANVVTEQEKLTSHVFNLHPQNSTRSLRLSSFLAINSIPSSKPSFVIKI